jgi:tRNA A-37 threonylcarbamoyl transferase component Bud32
MITKSMRKYNSTATEKMDKEVIPFFLKFSEMGISPKVIRRDESYVETEIVEAVDLSSILNCIASPEMNFYARKCNDYGFKEENTKPENVVEVYRQLGSHLANILNHGVAHNDAHARNIIVEGKSKAYLVDWERAAVLKPEEKIPCIDLNTVLKSTEYILWTISGRNKELRTKLEDALLESFDRIYRPKE